LNVIKHLDSNRDIVGWAFMRAMLKWQQDNPGVKHEDGSFYTETGILDICLTVNGEEVPFDDIIHEYERQMDSLIEQKARELVSNRAQPMIDILYQLERDLKEKAEQLFPEEWRDSH
jgi:hypothetical protein